MPRSAANVQRPGNARKTPEPNTAIPAGEGVAAAAKARHVTGPVDPTKIKQAVFTENGWVCPASPEQVTATEDDGADDGADPDGDEA